MKTAKTLSISALLLVMVVATMAVTTLAQTPRRRGARRPAGAKPAATQPPSASTPEPSSVIPTPATSPVTSLAAQPKAPVVLAVVNGQNVTSADLDPRVREAVETLDARIVEARNQLLEMEINTFLLASEAARRRMGPQQLYDLEVTRKITDPPAADVTRFMEENKDQLAQTDPAKRRQQVVEYLRGEREADLSEALVKRLRATTSIARPAPTNAVNLPASMVLATVAGRAITAAAINEKLKPIIYDLRMNTYRPERQALEQTIDDMLLLAEANRQSVGPEVIVRKEISEKLHSPTEAEVAKFFNDNKARLTGDLASTRNQIANFLQDQERGRLEGELSARLRKGADIRVLISEPLPPALAISVDDDPSRGPATAAVTIVEFTDFQCPSCAAMHPVLDEALKTYGARVRLVVRDYPLAQHTEARKAAEAANAANAQGKFFEYAALLFKRQNALDVPSLKKYASELGLNRVRFDAALDSGKFADEIKHDVAEGNLYGVGSTPTIFVNGVVLKELSREGLRAAIDRALPKGSR